VDAQDSDYWRSRFVLQNPRIATYKPALSQILT
jgi:hypothetical protein